MRWLLLGACALAIGCSERGGAPPMVDAGPPPDAGTDGAADAGDPAQILEVEVVRYGPAPGEMQPGAMLPVAVDLPQGGRAELMTDATGHVTFGGVDFSRGRAAVTAASATHAASRIGVGRADGVVRLEIMEYPPVVLGRDDPSFPLASGSVTGMMDDTHTLTVSATVLALASTTVGPAWDLRVRPGVPYSLVALEYLASPTPPPRGAAFTFQQWLVAPQPAATADVMPTLDFATRMMPVRVSGSARLPTRIDSPLRTDMSRPQVNVTTIASFRNATLGATSMIAVAADASVATWDVEYVRAVPDAEAVTFFFLGTAPENVSMSVIGYPAPGELTARMPDVPRTMNAFVAVGLHDAISWETFGDAVPNYIQVRQGTEIRWLVALPNGVTTGNVPELPSAADAATILGTGSLSGRPWFCERTMSLPFPLCARSASGRGVELLQ